MNDNLLHRRHRLFRRRLRLMISASALLAVAAASLLPWPPSPAQLVAAIPRLAAVAVVLCGMEQKSALRSGLAWAAAVVLFLVGFALEPPHHR